MQTAEKIRNFFLNPDENPSEQLNALGLSFNQALYQSHFSGNIEDTTPQTGTVRLDFTTHNPQFMDKKKQLEHFLKTLFEGYEDIQIQFEEKISAPSGKIKRTL